MLRRSTAIPPAVSSLLTPPSPTVITSLACNFPALIAVVLVVVGWRDFNYRLPLFSVMHNSCDFTQKCAMDTLHLLQMDPVQKAVINHTFGVSIPPKKKLVISCNICQLRFNSDRCSSAGPVQSTSCLSGSDALVGVSERISLRPVFTFVLHGPEDAVFVKRCAVTISCSRAQGKMARIGLAACSCKLAFTLGNYKLYPRLY
ncbi:Zinc finger protein 385B [Anabarilius grahami]|uniref:Zinc finger protein 385B n=1 Tax=Anabarilius grahami TaxID=495550 RepID=A0A3N0YW22_ANAGA|nr:Zinc finger protein 385B [Anabarilius grahami]